MINLRLVQLALEGARQQSLYMPQNMPRMHLLGQAGPLATSRGSLICQPLSIPTPKIGNVSSTTLQMAPHQHFRWPSMQRFHFLQGSFSRDSLKGPKKPAATGISAQLSRLEVGPHVTDRHLRILPVDPLAHSRTQACLKPHIPLS